MDKHKSIRRIIQTSDPIYDEKGRNIFPATFRYETMEERLAKEVWANEQKYKEAVLTELEQSNDQ